MVELIIVIVVCFVGWNLLKNGLGKIGDKLTEDEISKGSYASKLEFAESEYKERFGRLPSILSLVKLGSDAICQGDSSSNYPDKLEEQLMRITTIGSNKFWKPINLDSLNKIIQHHPNETKAITLIKKIHKMNNALEVAHDVCIKNPGFLNASMQMSNDSYRQKVKRFLDDFPDSEADFVSAFMAKHYENYEPPISSR